MEFGKIILLSIAAAILYGLVHDQITARVCLEYFTIGHPRMFASDSPTLHALYWGIAATWWAGLIIGLLLATASRAGSLPKLAAKQQLRPVAILILVMGLLAAAVGIYTYRQAHSGVWRLDMFFADANWIPAEAQAGFLADAFTHSMSYLSGFLGGLVLCVVTLIRRARLRTTPAATEVVAGVIS